MCVRACANVCVGVWGREGADFWDFSGSHPKTIKSCTSDHSIQDKIGVCVGAGMGGWGYQIICSCGKMSPNGF